jgi:YidC/Oxa1 family membrane protein insertase
MERRLVVFLALAFAILVSYFALLQWINPEKYRPKPHQQVAANQSNEKDEKAAEKNAEKSDEKNAEKNKVADDAKAAVKEGQTPSQNPTAEKAEASKSGEEAAKPADGVEKPKETPAPVEATFEQKWVTLGSADPKSPYRMLVTLTNRGAALARIDLNSPRYCDVDDRSGYLGEMIMDSGFHGDGCPLQVVGPGTPADEAGLKAGDLLKAIDNQPVTDAVSLKAILAKTKPKQKVTLSFTHDGNAMTREAVLRRRPLPVIAPEDGDPLSLLMTLQQYDDEKIPAVEYNKEKNKDVDREKIRERDVENDRELEGVRMRDVNWEIVSSSPDQVQFRRVLADKGLEVLKTYRLAQVPEASLADSNFPAYHLEFDIEIRNIGGAAHKVAYRLDGPNGLPTEGEWYAMKVARCWGAAGLRDYIVSFNRTPDMVGAPTIADNTKAPTIRSEFPNQQLKFIGVDAQYFSSILMPQHENTSDVWFEGLQPICVGKVDPKHLNLTNTSCRLTSYATELQPGASEKQTIKLFAGPKKPDILAHYGLGSLVYYGWFEAVAVPLVWILHMFYSIFHNYGIAIILLTILVRGIMFPFSRKQAINAIKMQELQPEIKKIQEMYKKDVEARTKAQQELFRKHNHNPLGGCVVAFIQLPVFVALYNSLRVDVELRDAPLISHAIRWCSNLAAPDMLFYWKPYVSHYIIDGFSFFPALGPYLNLLPIFSILVILWQQKKMMPPAADEQAKTQQKVMKYMMVFMGLMFFKVASGTCLYIIVSCLWGIGERKFLPKSKPVVSDNVLETRAQAKARQAAQAAMAKDRDKKKK